MDHIVVQVTSQIQQYGTSYGGFLKKGVPHLSSNFVGCSIINHPAIGVPPFKETSIWSIPNRHLFPSPSRHGIRWHRGIGFVACFPFIQPDHWTVAWTSNSRGGSSPGALQGLTSGD